MGGEKLTNEFKELVYLARKGDAHAFSLLYSQIYKELYRYARLSLRSREDAEDAVSEAVTDAFCSIGKLKDENAFRSWMFKILSGKCKRKIKDYYKSGGNFTENFSPSYTIDDDTIDIKNALSCLSDDEKMIISLTVYSGFDSNEAARILKMNRGTLRSRQSRAIAKLRYMLGVNKEEAL